MTPERFQRIRQVLDRRQPDLTVLLENVHKPHNFAAILRTADAVGVFEAHAVFNDGKLRTSLVSASGADRKRGFRILAAHPDVDAVDFRDVDLTQPVAFVLGQELDGLTEETRSAADQSLVIPMSGFVASLNVSVAAALLLFEAQRQRQKAGLYAASRLDPEVYTPTLFEWAYPNLAELCRKRGEPYPRLDDNGEFLGEVPR
jgi:tRNA (guanosine-2'-O-)-methyltransferase